MNNNNQNQQLNNDDIESLFKGKATSNDSATSNESVYDSMISNKQKTETVDELALSLAETVTDASAGKTVISKPITEKLIKPKVEKQKEFNEKPKQQQTETKTSESATAEMIQALKKSTKPNTLSGLKYNDIEKVLNSYKIQIEKALPKTYDSARFISNAITLLTRNKSLLNCNVESLLSSIILASNFGFNLINNDAYIIPFYNSKKGTTDANFIIGYKGLIKMMHNNNKVLSIYAETIHETDEYEIIYGINPEIKHKPDLTAEKTEINLIGAYAVAKYVNGGYNFIFLTKSEIESYKKRSKDTNYSIWKTDYIAMSKKTAIRRLAVYVPNSDEMQTAINTDDSVTSLNNTGFIEYDEISE